MKSFVRVVFALCMLSALFTASRADAEPAEPADPADPAEPAEPAGPAGPVQASPRESPVQLHLDAAAGISTAGGVLSALGLVRFGLVEVGGSYASSGLFSARTGGGLAAGAGAHRPGGGGWDVLVELGVNEHHVSGGLLTSDPGVSGSIPYGGLRAGVDWSFGNAAAVVHPTLGLWLFVRTDLESREASYTYQDRGLFSNGTESRSGSAMLGGGGEIGITLAGGFDLLP